MNKLMYTYRVTITKKWQYFMIVYFCDNVFIIKIYRRFIADLASGGSDDWAKGVARAKFAYTVELGDTGKFGFLLPPRYINVTGNEMFGAIKTLLKEARKIRLRQHVN